MNALQLPSIFPPLVLLREKLDSDEIFGKEIPN